VAGDEHIIYPTRVPPAGNRVCVVSGEQPLSKGVILCVLSGTVLEESGTRCPD
jgi:hypothetical protein